MIERSANLRVRHRQNLSTFRPPILGALSRSSFVCVCVCLSLPFSFQHNPSWLLLLLLLLLYTPRALSSSSSCNDTTLFNIICKKKEEEIHFKTYAREHHTVCTLPPSSASIKHHLHRIFSSSWFTSVSLLYAVIICTASHHNIVSVLMVPSKVNFLVLILCRDLFKGDLVSTLSTRIIPTFASNITLPFCPYYSCFMELVIVVIISLFVIILNPSSASNKREHVQIETYFMWTSFTYAICVFYSPQRWGYCMLSFVVLFF